MLKKFYLSIIDSSMQREGSWWVKIIGLINYFFEMYFLIVELRNKGVHVSV